MAGIAPLLEHYGEEGLELLASYLKHPYGHVLVTDRAIVLGRLVESFKPIPDILEGVDGTMKDALFIHFAWGAWRDALACLSFLDVDWLVYERRGRAHTHRTTDFLRLCKK